eukprot:454530-Pyramimonas_sp.AAC.1
MLGWIHTDETLSLIQDHVPQLLPEVQALIQSVPWRDDGRFLCATYDWVRADFGHCPSCSNPINYKRRVTHDYLLQTWKDEVIPKSLKERGISSRVDRPRELPNDRAGWTGARVKRQRRASADVIYIINNNMQQERKWAA